MDKVRAVFLLLAVLTVAATPAQAFEHFITADHGMLKDGNQPFRFVSFNVPNLNYIEDDLRFTQTVPYRLPDEFEMRDVFATVQQMGGRVVRIYTIPVKSATYPKGAPTYVLAPGRFNEDAFKSLDKMMALANEYGVRIIFPLVNNWPWMGGRPQYAAFRGKDPKAFWTDPQLIADFEATIRHLLERTNTVTGVKYKDDKAILCWETGNELQAPFSWTVKVTRFIKSLDRNHLVMDGSRADNDNALAFQPGALSEPSIDIVTTHHYESDATTITGHIDDNIKANGRHKVYVVGEFGFAPTSANEAIIDHVVAAKDDVAGALLWSLRFHDRDGGFYWHTEPLGGDLYKALHWPGFASGEAYDEPRLMAMIRREAFAIQGVDPPPLAAPKAPAMLPVANVGAISWRGSTGALSYDIERAETPTGPWLALARNVSDADVPYFPLFNDEDAHFGARYFYRVRAVNDAGTSPWSDPAGPVAVTVKVKLDTMKNLGRTENSTGVKAVMGEDRSFKEVRNRLAGAKGAELVYAVPGHFKSFDLCDFERDAGDLIQVLGSSDGKSWRDLKVAAKSFVSGETNYDYWRPKLYHFDGDPSLKYLKVVFGGAAQLARAEIAYTD